jgi:hypothetical protein
VSTQINVTVGSGGLSDKARQLQTAARQTQLEKERQQRIEAQGQEQRTANLAAAGRAPDGAPLFGPSSKQPEVERRPAATRFGTTEKWLVPLLQRPTAVELASPAVLGGEPGNIIIVTPAVRSEVYESPLQVIRPAAEASKGYVIRYRYTVTTQTAASGQNNLLLYSNTGGQFDQPYVGAPATVNSIGLDGAFTCNLYKQLPGLFPASSFSAFVVPTDSLYVEFDVFCGASSFRSCSANMYLGYNEGGSQLGNRYTLGCATSGSSSDSLSISLTKTDSQGLETALVSSSATGLLNNFAPSSSSWTRYAIVIGKTFVSVYRDGTRVAFETFSEPIAKDIYKPNVDIGLAAALNGVRSEVRYGPVRLETAAIYTADTYTPQALL